MKPPSGFGKRWLLALLILLLAIALVLLFGQQEQMAASAGLRTVTFLVLCVLAAGCVALLALSPVKTSARSPDRHLQSLVISDALLAQITQRSEQPMLLTDTQGHIVWVNSAFESASGFQRRELMDQTVIGLLQGPESDPDTLKTMQQGLLAQRGYTVEVLLYNKDKQRHWHAIECKPLFDDNGSLSHFFALHRDISVKKQIHQRLRHHNSVLVAMHRELTSIRRSREQVMQRIVSVIADVLNVERVSIWFFSKDKQRLNCEVLYERSKEHYTSGLELDMALSPRYQRALLNERYIAAHEARNDARTAEFTDIYFTPLNIFALLDAAIIHNGETVGVICVEHINEPRFWEYDEQLFVGSMADLVQVELVREERWHNESILERTGHVANVGGWEIDLNTMKLEWTRQTKRIHEVDESFEPKLEQAINFYAPEARPKIQQAVQQAITTGKGWDLELPFITARGRHIWVRAVGEVVVKEGKPERLYGTFQDVTERKQTQSELERTTALLRNVLSAASEVSIIATDPDGLITVFNRGAERLLGYRASELVGVATPAIFHDSAEVRTRGEQLSQELDKPVDGFRVFVEMAERRGAEKRQWSYLRKNGESVQVSLVVTAMRDEQQRIIGYLGIAQDITEPLNAQRALLESKAQYDELTARIPIGTYSVLLRKDGRIEFTYVSQRFCQMLGVTEKAVLEEAINAFKPAHPDDLPSLIAANEYARDNMSDFRWQGRFVINDEIRYFRIASTPTPVEGGAGLWNGVVIDVTDYCLAQQALEENEAKFRTLFERANDAILLCTNNQILDCNPCTLTMFRYEELAQLPTTIDALSPDIQPDGRDTRQQMRLAFELATRDQQARFDWWFRRGDGTLFPAEVQLSAFRLGEQTAWQMTVRDITGRKIAEQQAHEQHEHTQAIINNVLDGIITIDASGIVSSFNHSAEKLFGYRSEEMIGQNVNVLMPEPYHSEHDGHIERYLKTGERRIIGRVREVQARHRNGEVFPIELSVSQITRGGKPVFIGMIRDITERKRIEKMKSEFLSTVNHELRTPLTSIIGALSLIGSGALGPLDDKASQMVRIAKSNSQRLTQLINDLLDMDKMAAGKMVFDWQLLSVASLLEKAIQQHRGLESSYGVNFVVGAQPESALIEVDESRLLQVLGNLLSNAAKFSPSGADIDIDCQQQNHEICISVRDRGPGISEDFHARIFQKFSQADSSDSRRKGGTGLGLAISKELTESMGGRIGFESEPGQGARFFVCFPLKSAVATKSLH